MDIHDGPRFISLPEQLAVHGVTLREPAGPLPLISFPVEPAVLYGRNVSGKSKLLEALASGLGAKDQGNTTACWIHLHGAASHQHWAGLGGRIAYIVAQDARRQLPEVMLLDGPTPSWPEDASVQDLTAWILEVSGADAAVAEEIAAQNQWVLATAPEEALRRNRRVARRV